MKGRPVSRLMLRDVCAQSIGAFVMYWEIVTALAAHMMHVDAFDQPGVELGKKIAHGLLGHSELAAFAREFESSSESSGFRQGELSI